MTHPQIEEQDIVDLYLLRQLPPAVQAEFEQHYYACRECLDRLESSRKIITAIWDALAEKSGASLMSRRLFSKWPIWAAAAGLVLAALSVTLLRRHVPPPSTPLTARVVQPPAPLPVVDLASYRGGAASGATVSAAVAAKPFLLRLDLRGLETNNIYMVEVVTDSGSPVWSRTGTASPGAAWLELTVEGGRLAAGAFWVRLSATRSEGAPELLREYSLLVGS